jgi:hypothetical protein
MEGKNIRKHKYVNWINLIIILIWNFYILLNFDVLKIGILNDQNEIEFWSYSLPLTGYWTFPNLVATLLLLMVNLCYQLNISNMKLIKFTQFHIRNTLLKLFSILIIFYIISVMLAYLATRSTSGVAYIVFLRELYAEMSFLILSLTPILFVVLMIKGRSRV